MLDLHVHTHYSCDSKVTLDNYCKKAIELNMSHICFTDHIDYNKGDYGYGYYDMDAFFAEFNSVKDKYGHLVDILCGAEFSEPHIYKKEFEAFKNAPYDFIMGSIHFWIGDIFPSKMKEQGITAQEAFKKYWQEVKKAVSVGGFDSLAHLDFPKRYFGELLYTDEVLLEIFDAMVKNNIALEINTSTLRQGLDSSMPDSQLLQLYKQAGGKNITIGADTHMVKDLASGYLYAKDLANRLQLELVVFEKRKPSVITI